MSIKLSPGGRTDEGRNEISMRTLKKISNSEMNDKNKERAKIAKANMRRVVARCKCGILCGASNKCHFGLSFSLSVYVSNAISLSFLPPLPPRLTFLTCRELEKQQINILGTLKYVCVHRVCV